MGILPIFFLSLIDGYGDEKNIKIFLLHLLFSIFLLKYFLLNRINSFVFLLLYKSLSKKLKINFDLKLLNVI